MTILAAMTPEEKLQAYITLEALDLAITLQTVTILLLLLIGLLAAGSMALRAFSFNRVSSVVMMVAAFFVYWVPSALSPMFAYGIGALAFLTLLKDTIFRQETAVAA